MWKQILTTSFLAGSLDISAACVHAYLMSGVLPNIVLKYIASGVFGKKAFEGGPEMMVLGLLFHFVIAFACTAIFFLLYPKLKLQHLSPWVNAIAIALLAWVITTQVVVPMSKITPRPFDFQNALIAIGILIFCVGLPIAFMARNYFMYRLGRS